MVSAQPWSSLPADKGRFGAILTLFLVLFVSLAVLIPQIELSFPERKEAEAVPPHLVQLLERRVKEPSKPLPMPEAKVTPQPEKATPVVEVSAPVVIPPQLSVPKKEPQQKQSAPQQKVEQARAVAAKSGLLALQNQLSQLHSEPAAVPKPMQANVINAGAANQAEVERASAAVLTGSGGVAAASAPLIDHGLTRQEVRTVEVATVAKAVPVAAKASGSKSATTRGMQNIRQVFDTQKTALDSLYRRELRQDPALAGKVLLELVIEPDGSVSSCEIVSSELDNPGLELRLANRVRLFQFGADNVNRRTVRFPVDFMPS